MCGGWRVGMEDAHSIALDFDPSAGLSLFGVFDGHGGAFAGRYTAANFQPVFSATDGWKKYCTASVGGGGGDGDALLLAQALTDAMCRVDYALGELPQMKVST